jgi:U3 small nucleolar RNA-associated protein 11
MLSRNGPGSSITRGSKRFDGTVENSRGNESMSVEVVRLLKTQDLGYLRTVRNVAAKEVRELEERWVLAGGGELEEESEDEDEDDDFGIGIGMGGKKKKKQGQKKAPKKIVFCDGEEQRKKAKEEAEAGADDAQWEDEEDDEESPKAKEAEREAQNLERLEKKLRNARKKLKALSDAEFQLEVQQAKMAKTATSGGYTKNGHKIKVRERKR